MECPRPLALSTTHSTQAGKRKGSREDRAASHPGEGQESWRVLMPEVFGDMMCLFFLRVPRLKDAPGEPIFGG